MGKNKKRGMMDKKEKIQEVEGVISEIIRDLKEFGIEDRDIAMIWACSFVVTCDYFDLNANKIMNHVFDNFEKLEMKL